MRILIEHTFHNPYNPEKITGGVERYCHQLWSLLRENGQEVVLAVPSDTDSRFVDGETVVYVDRLSKSGAKALGKIASHKEWWTKIEQMSDSFDKVITNSELSSLAIFDCVKLIPKMVHINHFPFLATGCQMAFRYLLCCHFIRENGGRVLSSGSLTREKAEQTWAKKKDVIAEHYASAYSKITGSQSTHDGDVDVNIFPSDMQPLAKSNGKRILAVGRPEPGKKLTVAVKTLAILSQEGWECDMYITPYGKDFDQIVSLASETSVKVHVKRPHQEIMEAFSKSDCLLFTSKDETNGMTAFEAAASGCTVFYQTPEPDHFLKPSKAGIWLESFSPQGIAKQISGDLRPSSKTSIRSFFSSKYSNEAVANRIINQLTIG
jgi:glycosyltransferase involved in cell wall biosynthesis